MTNKDKYISIQELADLKGVSTRAIRMSRDKYVTREIIVRGGKSFEILLSSIELDLQEKYFEQKTQITSDSTALIPILPIKNLPTKVNEIALARLDLLREWQKYRKHHPDGKTRAGVEFIESYNTGMLYPHIFKVLGKTSIGSVERWKRKLGNTTDYHLLLPKYEYATEFRTSLTDYEKQVFLKILLHPNKFCVGKAISITKHILSKEGPINVQDVTFRRYANWFRDNHYDIWTLARDGEKALKDNVEPYILRDISKLEVGDVLVADGHKLSFLVQNPFTGKPTRATLIGFLDWKSTALVGYEIMLEENTQSIASALRNAIINLQNIPKIVYQDNGRAFKAKYFINTDFKETGFEGIYAKLGIQTVFAKPYNARAKVIERFFKEFQESFEKLLPTYSGSSIENKPAHFKRNEKFHKQYFKPNYYPTIDEVKMLVDKWLEFKNAQPCPNDKNHTIAEVFENRMKIKIDTVRLDDLMMTADIKTIYQNGIRFLGTFYYSDKLYGLKTQVMIRYSLFDLSEIKVYTVKNQFLCTAKRVTKAHPMAYHLGDIKDVEDLRQKIQKQKRLKNKTIKELQKFLPNVDLKFIEQDIEEDVQEVIEVKPVKMKKPTPREVQMNAPVFLNKYEKFEWLMKNGCTCEDDRVWLAEYKQSEEYRGLYET